MLLISRTHQLFQDHASAITHLLSNLKSEDILEAAQALFHYVIAKSYMKMHRRFQNKHHSTRYINMLCNLKIDAFANKQMTFTKKDLLFFERLEYCAPNVQAQGLKQVYELIKHDFINGKPNPNVKYCFTQQMSFEFHRILCHILCELRSLLSLLAVHRKQPSPPPDFMRIVDNIMIYGLSLTAIAYSSMIHTHLTDLNHLLKKRDTNKQPTSMPEMGKSTLEMDESGNGDGVAPGPMSAGVLDKDKGMGGAEDEENEENEDSDVDLAATDPFHTTTRKEYTHDRLESEWVPLQPWEACLNWLRLLVAHFQAAKVLSNFVLKSRPNSISIEIIAFPRENNHQMPLRCLVNHFFPKSEAEVSLDIDITATEVLDALQRCPDTGSTFKPNGALWNGHGQAAIHCEAAIASLIYSVFHDGYFHGEVDERIRHMFHVGSIFFSLLSCNS
jgi:hypothetical protein